MKRGNCYATAEALYHLLGGKKAGWRPMVMHWEGDTHWFLEKWIPWYKGSKMKVRVFRLDPLVSLFDKPPDYSLAKGCGFLTKKPSKKARELMQRMLWQEVK